MSLAELSTQEYPGRLLLFGRDLGAQYDVIGYAVTGRSPSSQARRLVWTDDGALQTEVTRPDLLQQGNPKLLLYSCIKRFQDHWLVSNGAQTDLMVETAQRHWEEGRALSPACLLLEAFARPCWVEGNAPHSYIDLTLYEPDGPTFTPRISGVLGPEGGAMSLVKRDEGVARRSLFTFSLRPGHGAALSTYAGINVPPGEPIPSFAGEPIDLELAGESPRQVAEALYKSLGPKSAQPGVIQPDTDFRVGVAVLFLDRATRRVTSHVINRHS